SAAWRPTMQAYEWGANHFPYNTAPYFLSASNFGSVSINPNDTVHLATEDQDINFMAVEHSTPVPYNVTYQLTVNGEATPLVVVVLANATGAVWGGVGQQSVAFTDHLGMKIKADGMTPVASAIRAIAGTRPV